MENDFLKKLNEHEGRRASRLTRAGRPGEAIHTLHQEKDMKSHRYAVIRDSRCFITNGFTGRKCLRKRKYFLLEEIIRLYSEVKGIHGYAA